MIIFLDGVIGYFNEIKNNFTLRHGVVKNLIELSYYFRIIAVSTMRESKI